MNTTNHSSSRKRLIPAILLTFLGITFLSCDDDKKSNVDSCIPICLNESEAVICNNDNAMVQECGENKCFAGVCAKSTTEACSTASRECVGTISYRVCDYGFWSEPISCGENKVCENGLCTEEIKNNNTEACTSNQVECSSDENGYRICVSGNWSNVISCPVSTTCKNGQCVGDDIKSTLPCEKVNESKCVSSTRIQICDVDNFWRFMDCPSDVPVCDDDVCNPPECNNGESRCISDKIISTCINSQWNSSECPSDKPLCKNNTCVVRSIECTPGETKCLSDKEPQKCNGDGYWETQGTCTGTSTCYEGKCMEKCTPGEKMCATDSLAYLCNVSGFWEEKACTGNSVCNNGECKDCKDGESKCLDSESAQICKNGTWKTSKCDYYYCSDLSDGCAEPGDKCSGVESFCIGNQLVWCNGKTLEAVDCYSCLSTVDYDGATCEYNNLASTTSGKQCDYIGDTSSGSFIEDSNYKYRTADCLECKEMKTDSSYDKKLWVPVNESHCR